MEYFDLFKPVQINGIPLTDISNLIELKGGIEELTSNYELSEDETVVDAANNIYNDDKFYWLLYLANPTYIFDELLTTDEFNSYIDKNFNVTAFKLNESCPKPNSKDFEFYAKDGTGTVYYPGDIDSKRSLFIFNELLPTGSKLYLYDTHEHQINADKQIFKDSAFSYLINDYWYDRIPEIYDSTDVIEIKTFEDHEFEKNEEKRTIRIVKPKYIQRVIDSIREFNDKG